MNKALLIFDNKLCESVIFLMQLKGFWPSCILLHILNMQTCCSKKIWIECCTSLVKTTIKLLADINSTAFAICCLTTIVELVWTVHTVPDEKLNTSKKMPRKGGRRSTIHCRSYGWVNLIVLISRQHGYESQLASSSS